MITPIDRYRQLVEQALGDELSEAEWAFAEQQGYFDDIALANESGVLEVAKFVQTARRTYSGAESSSRKSQFLPSSRPQRLRGQRKAGAQQTSSHTTRVQALSILLAIDALKWREGAVLAFRREVLGDKLLPSDGIEVWVRAQAQRDGPPTRLPVGLPQGPIPLNDLLSSKPIPLDPSMELFDTTPLERKWKNEPAEGKIVPSILRDDLPHVESSLEELAAEGVPIRTIIPSRVWEKLGGVFLEYPVLQTVKDDDSWATYDASLRRIPIAVEHVLGRLKDLSEALARRYRWRADEGVTFVLCGWLPLVRAIDLDIEHKRAFPALTRITLTVDPELSPREVADAYREARTQLAGQRMRSLSEKHIQLALFITQKPEGQTGGASMQDWNRQHPEWRYSQVTNFLRDCKQASRRLLYPPYDGRTR